MSNKLYAWVDTTKLGIGDHTWVSTYTPATGQPDPKRGYYWYCWGVSHDSAKQIGVGDGGVHFAKSIAEPHNLEEDVGIEYLHDGVCHQMANRLLRFSLDSQNRPITVKSAKGYQLSVAGYGEYGGELNRFNTECLDKWNKIVSNYQESIGSKDE